MARSLRVLRGLKLELLELGEHLRDGGSSAEILGAQGRWGTQGELMGAQWELRGDRGSSGEIDLGGNLPGADAIREMSGGE